MRTLYHNFAQRATRAHLELSILERVKIPYKTWLADQGAVLRLGENDNTWWLDFC